MAKANGEVHWKVDHFSLLRNSLCDVPILTAQRKDVARLESARNSCLQPSFAGVIFSRFPVKPLKPPPLSSAEAPRCAEKLPSHRSVPPITRDHHEKPQKIRNRKL